MSQYPPETLRALDIQSARWDHAEHIRHTHAELFVDAVRAGADIELIAPWSREGKRLPVSAYLGECGKEAQALLLKASAQAMKEDTPLARMVQAYVKQCASDYSDYAAEVWGGE